MDQGHRALKSLGYAQSGAVDASTLISSLTFQGQPGAGIPPGTAFMIITPQEQAIRWRDDGAVPTAAVGYPLPSGTELRYDGADMANLRVISQVAGAIVNVIAYAAP